MEIENNIERFNPDFKQGLSREQIEARKEQNLVNKSNNTFKYSNLRLFVSIFFNLFNFVLLAVIGLMIAFKLYFGLLFALVLIFDIVISAYFNIKAKKANPVLKLTEQKVIVVRNGKSLEISAGDIVLDDIILVEKNSYVCVDGVILQGEVGIDESMINGESNNVYKTTAQEVKTGSFITSGRAFIRADRIGKDRSLYSSNASNKKTHSASSSLKALHKLLFIFGIAILATTVLVVLTFLIQGKFNGSMEESVKSLSGSIMAMVPTGMYLLSITAFAVSSIRLSKNNVQINDYSAMEMLAKADIVCFDKTGTITDNNLVVKKVVLLKNSYSEVYISQAVSNVLCATNDYNSTAKALRSYFSLELSSNIVTSLPFNSVNKYSGASFKGNKTFIIGAPEFMPLFNKAGVLKRCEEYTKEGYRVVVLGEGTNPITNNKYSGSLEAIAIIVLKEHIRESIPNYLNALKTRGVDTKVITGDDVLTAVAIASEAGIDNPDKYISLAGMSIDEVKDVAFNYNVFGRASPEQKEALITAYQENGKVVAMIGDGSNDVLALEQADCSVCVSEALDIVKNTSQMIMTDSNFAALSLVAEEGERSTNSLNKIVSLFSMKTVFGVLLTVIFTLVSIFTNNSSTQFPFSPNNLYLLDIVICGVGAAFLVFDDNKQKIKGGFFSAILKNVIPAATMISGSVIVIFWLYILQLNNSINLGIYNTGSAVSMSIIALTVLSAAYLYQLFLPLDKKRKLIIIIVSSVCLVLLFATWLITFISKTKEPLLDIPFLDLGWPAFFDTIILIIVFASIYLFVYRLIDVFKGEKKDED